MQAAVLRVKLKYLDIDNEKRRQIANKYSSLLEGAKLQLPSLHEYSEHVFHLYAIRIKKRNEAIEYLKMREIQAGIHYPIPVHLQPAYINRVRTAANMSITETLSEEVLSLPMYPELESQQVGEVVRVLLRFLTTN